MGVEGDVVTDGMVTRFVGIGSLKTGVMVRCWQSLTSRLTVRSSATPLVS